MSSKILVATDLSEASERMVWALRGLRAIGAREAILTLCFNIRDVGTLAHRLMELAEPSFQKQKRMGEITEPRWQKSFGDLSALPGRIHR